MARHGRASLVTRVESHRWALALVLAGLLGSSGTIWAQQKAKPATPQKDAPQAAQPSPQPAPQPSAPKNNAQQMKGLDEQVQEIKSDVLDIAQELSRLEEKLLFPSGTQVAVFVAMAKGDMLRLDAVRLSIDGQLVAQYVYSFKELDALRKGGVQRVYVGNVTTGDHQIEAVIEGKLEGGADFNRTEHFTFRKEVKPKLVGLKVAGGTPIALEEW